ncbi:MAG: FG-GAP repeat domain-containing protein [Myxococcota bacterium]
MLFALLAACSDYEVTPKREEPAPPEDTSVTPPTCAEAGEPFTVPSSSTCLVVAEPGTFTPVVEWQWNSNATYGGYDDIMSTPAAANVTDDDGDGDVDEDDVPDLAFTSFSGGAYTSAGTLTLVSGDGSGTWWSILDAGGYALHSSGNPAIGDIDADGVPEVCTPGFGVGVVCVNPDGSFKWAGGTEVNGYGAPAFADLDQDGQAEVIFGRQVLNSDGSVRWTGTGGYGAWLSFAVDLDGDERLEVIAGNTAYRGNGITLWTSSAPDGWGAAGDFDLDGLPEIVHVSSATVYLTGGDGTIWWSASVPGGGGGPPTVADFDNDGYPEVGVAGAYYYTVFDTDGSVRWSAAVQDWSSSVTGSSVFDFEGDGASDVVYADEITLWVYDGATGAVKLQEDGHASGTIYEYPLILDVDRDGSTEIVLPSNNYAYSGYNGITVIGDADDSWRPSRPVWNQFAYHITNVENDGGIPVTQAPNWATWNSFRAGGSDLGDSTDLADLELGTPEVCTYRCEEGVVEVLVPVENTGLAGTTEFEVAIYRGPNVEVLETVPSLQAGAGVYLGPYELTEARWGGGVRAVVDEPDAVEECDETDNDADLGEWPCP